jgi:hypothetical protein
VKFKYMSVSALLEIFKRATTLRDWPWGGKDRPSQYARDLVWLALYRLNFPPLYRAELSNSWLWGRLLENKERYAWLDSHQGHSFFGTAAKGSGLTEETRRNPFVPSPLIASYLNDLLTLCDQKGIVVYWVIMPISEESFAAMTPSYRLGYLAHISKIAQAHPSVKLDDNWKSWPFEYFGDSSHLNAVGAHRFSMWLKSAHLSGGEAGMTNGRD